MPEIKHVPKMLKLLFTTMEDVKSVALTNEAWHDEWLLLYLTAIEENLCTIAVTSVAKGEGEVIHGLDSLDPLI